MALVDKKTLKHLADLARIKITEKEEDKFLMDLEKILEHFNKLQEINTDQIEPMTGGTTLFNETRSDKASPSPEEIQNILINSFPEKEGDTLKIPPIFE